MIAIRYENNCSFYITDRRFGFYLWEIYKVDCETPLKKGLTRSIVKAAEKIKINYLKIVDSGILNFDIDENSQQKEIK